MKDRQLVDLLIFGAGGHAKVVSDCARKKYPRQIMISGDKTTSQWRDFPVFPQSTKSLAEWYALCPYAFVAIGDPVLRKQITSALEAAGFILVSVTHSSAVISPSAQISAGSIICPNAVINADVQVGKGCIINTGAIIEHDCKIGAFSHVSPGAVLGGGVTLGEHCRICLGANISDHIKVGSHTIIGAGAVVLSSIPEGVLAAGIPAEILKHYSTEPE